MEEDINYTNMMPPSAFIQVNQNLTVSVHIPGAKYPSPKLVYHLSHIQGQIIHQAFLKTALSPLICQQGWDLHLLFFYLLRQLL